MLACTRIRDVTRQDFTAARLNPLSGGDNARAASAHISYRLIDVYVAALRRDLCD
jgi:hypothetical protein